LIAFSQTAYGRHVGLRPLSMILPRWLPSAVTQSIAFPDPKAITRPSGDQVGRAKPLVATRCFIPDPSARITEIALELQKLNAHVQLTNAILWPSGAHVAW